MNKKNVDLKVAVDIALAVWIIAWLYYALFNWDVFAIKLNTNLGFAVIGGYPFVFFFILGLLALGFLKYVLQYNQVQQQSREKDQEHKVAMLEKDIEILKLKEVLFKMQTTDLNKSTANLNALHSKLDELSKQVGSSADGKKKDGNETDEKTS
jgi:uncharacterized membrane protein YraQ (UPF0718 family)